jgi:uncharacterized protein
MMKLSNGTTSKPPKTMPLMASGLKRQGVFKDAFALDWLDERVLYGEDRYAIISMAETRLLYVAYTMRGETIRIISARGAEPYEKRRYQEENAY